MTQQLIPFLYQDEHLVRAFPGTDGQPWFVAADVCRILGLRNVSLALQGLDEDEKGICNAYTNGGLREHLTVCEAGVYTLIIRSRRPEAAPFRRWVTHEVLPSIRRTGGYRFGSAKERKAALREWRDLVNAACRASDLIKRLQGPGAAMKFAITVFAEIGYDISRDRAEQGELDLKVVGGTDTANS